MTVVDGQLSRRDIAILGRLHVETLPDSTVSIVGLRYAEAFYRYLCRSRHEVVFLERGNDGTSVAGACIVSLQPETLSRRLLMATPLLPFAMAAAPRLVANTMHGKLKAVPSTSPTVQPAGPEIILIFTLAELRSRGCGSRLLARSEAWLVSHNYRRLFVKTRDDAANRAIGFYLNSGFSRIESVVNKGKALILFDKNLH